MMAGAAWAQQTQVASDTLKNTACSSSCGSGGQLGANWKQNSGDNLTESSSGVTGGYSANGYDYRDQAYWAGTGSFGNDMYSQVSCANIGVESASRACGVSVRMSGTLAGQSTTSGYMFYATSDANFSGTGVYHLYVTNGGTSTSLGTSSDIAIANPVVLNLQIIGSTYTATAGGTTIFTGTDSTISTGGVPGILVANGSSSPLLYTWTGGTAASQPTVANPTSSLATGSYTMPQTGVTLSDSTSGASICYMTNGGTPTAATAGTCDSQSGTEFTYSTALTFSATTTLTLLGTKSGDLNSSVVTYTYTQSQVANPTATNGTGTYNNAVSETLSDATGSSVICYRTDGTAPSATTAGTCDSGSTTYSGAFNVPPTSGTGTVKALGTESGYLNSSVVTFTYTFTVSAVSASPSAGTYTSTQSVTLSIATTTGASIYYNLTGSPTCSSTLYTGAIAVNSTETIYAVGCKTNYNNSSTLTAAYTINVVANPTASPVAGGYFTSQTVTLSDATSGATILYCQDTINTCTPSSTYSTALTQSATGYIRSQGTKTSYGSSSVVSFSYVINPSDQTGSYAFSENFQNYVLATAAPCTTTYGCVNTTTYQQVPMDAWNTAGNWTLNGSLSGVTLGGSNRGNYVQPVPDTVLGGTAAMLYGGNQSPGFYWVTYTGATGWNGSNQGQYSKALFHNGISGFAPCVYTFSNSGGTQNGYSLCLTSSGSAYFSKVSSGSASTIASASGLTFSDGESLELRSLGGQHQPLLNGAQISGMSATYNDSTFTTGNPGAAGIGLYNWTGGTINASSPPSPISYTPTYSNSSSYAWNTSGDVSWEVWPFNLYVSANGGEEQTVNATVQNTSISVTGSTVTVGSTLNPGVGTQVVMGSVFPVGVGVNMGGTVTTLSGTNSSTIVYTVPLGSVPANSSITESGTTATVNNSSLAPFLYSGQTVSLFGVTPSGYNGTYPVLSSGSTTFTITATSGLGTASTPGYALTPGYASTLNSSYALGALNSSGITQNMLWQPFLPAQWILGTVNVNTTSSTVRNWFFKLDGNSAILGGAGCYDLIGYYIGTEPMYQNGSEPPYASGSSNPACAASLEYCGTNFLHITKDTIATNNPPLSGGCTANPNYDVVTVSGSFYIPMQGDKILSMYQPNGYLDVYCLGTSNSSNAPNGDGCPSTTNYYRVIHAFDADLQTANAVGNAQGYPGVWASTNAVSNVPMAVFSNVSMGSVTSGVTCNSITSTTCINPTTFIQQNEGPL
jgi:hypothetical protein